MGLLTDQPLIASWLALSPDQLAAVISEYYCTDEAALVRQLITIADPAPEQLSNINTIAEPLIRHTRASTKGFHIVDQLLQEYSLSDEDGITLMCLAEALLRIPDAATRNALIKDKLSGADWDRHFDSDNSLFVNLSTWGLLVAGRFVQVDDIREQGLGTGLKKLLYQCGAPALRAAMDQAMKVIGEHFVMGRGIDEANNRAQTYREQGYCYSFDMLGEAAHTRRDADRYLDSYINALDRLAAAGSHDSLSIKLSALHPRYEESQRERALPQLITAVTRLVTKARGHGIAITIDAEEADRLELSLALFKQVYQAEATKGWGHFGLAVQAYSKRALPVLCWLTRLATDQGDTIPVRLVKGAYWDSEIKHCQQLGLTGYPVFTQKEATDTSYLACARLLLSDHTRDLLYPQFASHNGQTIASLLAMAGDRDFEFQRLHGMGEGLYESLQQLHPNHRVRIYAPVGSHEDLLPYLVRRLLENGANGSFVHKLSDPAISVEDLSAHPTKTLLTRDQLSNPAIPLPTALYSDRKNSIGTNLAVASQRLPLLESLAPFQDHQWTAAPMLADTQLSTDPEHTRTINSPHDHQAEVGHCQFANSALAKQALTIARAGYLQWYTTPVETRAQMLETTAQLLEQHRPELMALCIREAGKTLQDAIDEIREAIDFCRYYARQGRRLFGEPQTLAGPTGEANHLSYEGRGVFVCISPWNFPLAIFIGQISAALMAGNSVIAKPAEATSLIAYRAVQLLYQAGIPKSALVFLPGSGSELGAVLNASEQVDGVAFTGSTDTARHINQTLAQRPGPIASLIAETGGLNAMLVDSTALPEQVATDVIRSAFGAAGQRCSALRVLYVQEDIAQRVIELIKGAMDQLLIGNSGLISTDIGPVITAKAQQALTDYIDTMKTEANDWYQTKLPKNCHSGSFVAPTLIEIDSISEMGGEQFGPILHLVRFAAEDLDQAVDDINASGFGLTLGIHSRNITTYETIARRARVGNIYINRHQVGAVVGVQPFGGRGLSGTGPKAGGPNYLLRFATEKTISLNTAAIGGNAQLLTSADKP